MQVAILRMKEGKRKRDNGNCKAQFDQTSSPVAQVIPKGYPAFRKPRSKEGGMKLRPHATKWHAQEYSLIISEFQITTLFVEWLFIILLSRTEGKDQ